MRQRSPFSVAAYQAWRDKYPWTNAQIADELDATAEEIESAHKALGKSPEHGNPLYLAEGYRWQANRLRDPLSRLSKKDIDIAFCRLVKKCEFCDKKALYSYGQFGRCSKHRNVTPEWRARYLAERDRMLAERSANYNEPLLAKDKQQAHARAFKKNRPKK